MNINELADLAFAVNTVSADRASRISECKKAVADVFDILGRGEKVEDHHYARVLTRLLLEVCRGD
ncbi:hypothetical protein [Mesorhizobium sp. ZC-5]|uniref:hypothetical protein n=1 Tax=Mesorhizobium sp. ZC-5 TaxID=2986066 RepID=UPI0021E98391|nr:hypothetical protein [Mesorhizobium sp. ZC-5]MCV3239676.1 hypothetical protein [Mesorhizobium sp. ZC-5]